MPAASAAAITSSSRTEPPGWTTARTPRVDQHLQAVGEREERVRRRHRAGGPVARAGHREPRGVDPVDLAHADADRGAVGGEQDRVGLDRADRPPGERQVGQHLRRTPPTRRPAATSTGSSPGASTASRICTSTPPLICRHSAGSGANAGARSSRMFFFAASTSTAPSAKDGATTHLGEDVGDLLGHLDGDLAVDRDHPAERRDRVARVRLAVRLGDVGADRDAARVGVLDDGDRRLGEVVRGPPRRVGVDVVVVRHLLAVQLLGLRQPGAATPGRRTAPRAGAGSRRTAASSCACSASPANSGHHTSAARELLREPVRDRDVVLGDVGERPRRQRAPLRQREAAGRRAPSDQAGTRTAR